VLFTADIGVRTADKLIDGLRQGLKANELSDEGKAWGFLRDRSAELLRSAGDAQSLARPHTPGKPYVLLVIGVNGAGKTTTIGKLAHRLIADGKKVLIGAGDTFRAAAVDQLAVWAKRVGAEIVDGEEGADPSSVLFDAVKRAEEEQFDVVLLDTAGRLHTNVNLVKELQKVGRVIGKALDGAPHEVLLVLDGTTGQNAIAQAHTFTEAMGVSGQGRLDSGDLRRAPATDRLGRRGRADRGSAPVRRLRIRRCLVWRWRSVICEGATS
jgi:fused signal recognition particle receptor